jgi:hypothetical protein
MRIGFLFSGYQGEKADLVIKHLKNSGYKVPYRDVEMVLQP